VKHEPEVPVLNEREEAKGAVARPLHAHGFGTFRHAGLDQADVKEVDVPRQARGGEELVEGLASRHVALAGGDARPG
jgi:hypothetical protein